MASLGMGQSYELSEEIINRIIEPNRIGNYAYGYLNDSGSFIVKYVGRSDSDLQSRIKHGLQDRLNDENCKKYERFKFSYASNVKEAYDKECRNYHDFGGEEGLLNNVRHPDKPDGEYYKCHICGE